MTLEKVSKIVIIHHSGSIKYLYANVVCTYVIIFYIYQLFLNVGMIYTKSTYNTVVRIISVVNQDLSFGAKNN